MPLGVWTDSGTWAPAKTTQVWRDDGTWARAKKVSRWNGTAWVLAWTHPVTVATLSLSKTSVAIGETYNVVLDPTGVTGSFPAGSTVTFRYAGYTSGPRAVTEGQSWETLSGVSHAAAGTYQWYADVTTKGGNTTFGPISQSVAVTNTTVSITSAPTWVFSTSQSGTGGTGHTIASGSFTIAVGTPGIASKVVFQLALEGGGWTTYGTYNSPGATTTHTQAFSTVGSWAARAVVTQTNGTEVYSTEKAVECYQKDLTAKASPTSPVAGNTITYTAGMSGDAVAWDTSTWQYTRPADAGVWKNYGTNGQNPLTWTPGSADDITWRWKETYSDGSIIYSNTVRSIVAAAPSVVTVNGGHCHNIQAGMDSAVSQGKDLRLTGTFYLYTNVYIPSNLNIVATGAGFYCNSSSATNNATFNAGRFKNDPKGNAGQYGQAGNFVWDGGTFNCNGDGGFTISHSPGFIIKNIRIYKYCKSSNTGHAIEINSSGGADNVSGPYTVQILDSTFEGTNLGQRSNSNDEPVSYDWNWGSSDGSADSGSSDPLWRPGNSISESTQVMCHNVRIAGNTFHRQAETGGWEFALCAIGGHDASDNAVKPSYRHNHFLIENNVIHGAVGSTGTSSNKGAIHLFRGRQMIARNNTLYGGVQKRYLTAEDTGDLSYLTAYGNVSYNPTLSAPNGITIEG